MKKQITIEARYLNTAYKKAEKIDRTARLKKCTAGKDLNSYIFEIGTSLAEDIRKLLGLK